MRFWSVGAAVSLIAGLACADVVCNPMFADGMVLQRDIPVPVWGTADPGEQVTVTVAGQKKSTAAGADGKWMVKLDPMPAGAPVSMTVTGRNTVEFKDVLLGDVWVCSGQSNMQWTVRNSNDADKEIAAADFPQIRLCSVALDTAYEPKPTAKVSWAVCSPKTVPTFSAVGYFFGRHLNRELNVPIGLINTSWGGTPAEAWTPEEELLAIPQLAKSVAYMKEYPQKLPEHVASWEKAYAKWQATTRESTTQPASPALRAPTKPTLRNQNLSSVLYNAMVHPLTPYGIKGAIWYQGEANAGRANQYPALLSSMITGWRKAWGQGDFPFLIVQLTSYMPNDTANLGNPGWASLREAQWKVAQTVPNTGMACIIDIGDVKDIHPRNKQDVGKRLGLLAERMVYGRGVVASGPTFKSVEIQGGQMRIAFDHAEPGLVVKGEKPEGFILAGADGKWHVAEAKVDGTSVVVSSPGVPQPKFVRYGWSNSPACTLYNAAGLPAVPFRTDTQ